MRWWAALGLWLLAAYSTTAWDTNPGFAARITKKGLDYALKLGIQVLQKELPIIKVPDLHVQKSIKMIGRVSFTCKSINVLDLILPKSAITLVPGVGLRISISNGSVHLNGKWGVQAIFVKDHGSFDMKVKGVSISLILKLGSDRTGRPTVSPSDCRSFVSRVSLKIRGSFSPLYRLLRKPVNSALRKAMTKQICPAVVKASNEMLSPILQTLPVNKQIDRFAAVDYSLVSPPLVMAEALDLYFKGQFYDVAGHTRIPLTPPPLQFPVEHSHMLYFGISEYFFNTAGVTYKGAGALVFNLTDDMIPKNIKIRLSTSSLGMFIPQLQIMYPNMLMKIHLAADSAPFVAISPDKLAVTATCNIEGFAILPSKLLAHLFTLHLSISVSGKVSVRDMKLVGSISLDSFQLSLKHSTIGFFLVKPLETAMKCFISYVIVPFVNGILANGYPLPLPDKVQLRDVVVEPKQHYLLIAASVVYGK